MKRQTDHQSPTDPIQTRKPKPVRKTGEFSIGTSGEFHAGSYTLAALPAASRPRIVTLPHFHGDDRFYHWRRYGNCFAKADATLLFSHSIADQLGLPERFSVVPGGGVRADEHGDPTVERRFREVLPDTTPSS